VPKKVDCIPLLKALAAAILLTAGRTSGGGVRFDAPLEATPVSAKAPACVDQYGYEKVISVLPEISGDLVAFLNSRAMHPDSYQIPSSERIAAFEAWVTDVLDGVDRMRRGESVDWCAVAGAKATAAGYTLYRFHDSGPGRTGRYFLLGQDTSTGNQQAPFVINPEARRNIVIEAPHVPNDPGSGVGAARVFTSDLAPRALILNGASRCSLPLSVAPAECAGTTAQCTGVQAPFPRSDMAHTIHTLFHSFHKLLSDRPPPTDRPFALPVRFAQFHTAPAEPVISTGTSDQNQPSAISNTIKTLLAKRVACRIHSCNDGNDGTPGDSILGVASNNECADFNPQALYTNTGGSLDCNSQNPMRGNNRWIQIEGAFDWLSTNTTVDGTAPRPGWFQIMDAMRDPAAWGLCDLTCEGGYQCSLGPAQLPAARTPCPP
jgi:hypothetical protein